jgi:NitT/TauT family transport system substrate-binding protein
MRRRDVLAGPLIAASSIAAFGLRPARAQSSLSSVRLISAANDDVTPVLYALSQGWLREAGLDVELMAAANGAAVAPAVVGGSADLGRSNLFPLVLAHAKGVPFTVVAPSGFYVGQGSASGRLLFLKDGPIHRGRDLVGRVVGAQGLTDIDVIAAKMWCDADGGDSSRIKFVELSGQEAAIALDSGRIDAADLVDPILGEVLATGKYQAVDLLYAIAPHFLIAAWYSTRAYAESHPAVIHAFSAVLERANAYCNAHQDQTAPLLSQFSHVPVETILHSVRNRYALTVRPADVQPMIDAAAKYKEIPQAYPARDIIDPNAVR